MMDGSLTHCGPILSLIRPKSIEDDVQGKVLIFEGKLHILVRRGGYPLYIYSTIHIKVGRPGLDREALFREFEVKKVMDADRAWGTECAVEIYTAHSDCQPDFSSR